MVENHRDDQPGGPDLRLEEVRAALASLSDDDRDVVVMRCWDGLAVTDIAALLDCTPNAVSVRLHKARRKLLDRLDRTDPVVDGQVPVDPQPRTTDRHGH